MAHATHYGRCERCGRVDSLQLVAFRLTLGVVRSTTQVTNQWLCTLCAGQVRTQRYKPDLATVPLLVTKRT